MGGGGYHNIPLTKALVCYISVQLFLYDRADDLMDKVDESGILSSYCGVRMEPCSVHHDIREL